MALIHIGGKSYEIVHENRNGWNPEAFRDRYSEVLERYDFIIGDWGYSQLRLKGFFRDNHQKATKDSTFSSMSDYINEYCNFGCAYFILEKTQSTKKEPGDFDLDAYERPKTDETDALVDDAERSDEFEIGEEDETASAKEAAPAPIQERQKHNYRENRHRSSNRNNENRNSDENSSGGESRKNNDNGAENRGNGEQRGGKRENQGRKNFRGNDNRGKKPFRLAANETAAGSAEATNRPSKKDTERPV